MQPGDRAPKGFLRPIVAALHGLATGVFVSLLFLRLSLSLLLLCLLSMVPSVLPSPSLLVFISCNNSLLRPYRQENILKGSKKVRVWTIYLYIYFKYVVLNRIIQKREKKSWASIFRV